MNELQIECFDVIESTLQDECYFMSGRLPVTVASRSLPPPVVGALERRRLAAYRTSSEEYAIHLAAWNRSSRPQPPASPSSAGYSSSASEYSGSTQKPARGNPLSCRGTVPRILRVKNSGSRRRASLCRQCGKMASECPGAKHDKGASQRCSFKCKTCGVGPLLCSCKTSFPSPATAGTSLPSKASRNRVSAVLFSGILTPSTNARGGGGASVKPAAAARRPRTCRNCGKTLFECNGAKGGIIGGAQNCQFKCVQCGSGPLFCKCAGKENSSPSVHA
jgi:hypothetical protein